MLDSKRKLMIYAAIVLFAVTIIWLLYIAPEFSRISPDFAYRAEVFSLDNFYDEEKEKFIGDQISKTIFSYEIVSREGEVLIVKNVFDVRTIADEKIFSVERLYDIDSRTGMHVPGHGDKDRNGYLFAPRNLNKQDYVYWHINYDAPATMKFQGEEELFGLTVYRYETDYHADQTANLGHLPGVPEKRGVNLDINLQVWVEPVSGRMIKYEDNTTAYYYDIKTGGRLHPWNKFNNEFTDSSILEQVKIARAQKTSIFIFETVLPTLLAGAAMVLLFLVFRGRREKRDVA